MQDVFAPIASIIQMWKFGPFVLVMAAVGAGAYFLRRGIRAFLAYVRNDPDQRPIERWRWYVAFNVILGIVLGGYIQLGADIVTSCSQATNTLSCLKVTTETKLQGVDEEALWKRVGDYQLSIPAATQIKWLKAACVDLRQSASVLRNLAVYQGKSYVSPSSALGTCAAYGL